MGNDQSKSDEDRRSNGPKSYRPPRPPPPREQGVSRDELNQLLEQQRREYERKLAELNVRSVTAANVNQSVRTAREAKETSDKNIDQILAQQMRDFVQIAYNNNTPSPGASNQRVSPSKPGPVFKSPVPSGEGPSTSNVSSIERQRSPYSFTKDDLQNTQRPAPQINLYPNLQEASPNPEVYPLKNAQGYAYNNARSPDEFVFVERNKSPQETQPSAPPMPTNATGAIRKNYNSSKPNTPRPKANKNEDEGLNCKTCHQKFGLYIFQCSKGHSSCRDCKIRNASCGICRGPIGDTRNITVEAIVAETKIHCPNSDEGCNLIIKTVDIDAHLKECPFGDFLCPLAVIFGQRKQCRWKGKLSQIVSHFDDAHPEHRQANIDTEMVLINIVDDNHIVHLIDMASYIFLVHMRVAGLERKIYMTVQLLGTQISASKWNYELQVYNKREPRRKFSYTDICHSNVIPLEEVFGESRCVAIPQSYAMTYVNEGCLNYKFYIKRDCDIAPATRGKWRGGGRGRGRGRGARA